MSNNTEITVVGRVATAPRRVRLENGTSVTNFRLASTARRFDQGRQEWVDGETFWSDVECWNELGGNVARSLSKGDPVVVVGSVWTRSWESENGKGSTSQIKATAVGPNLARGWADFTRPARTATGGEQVEEEPGPGSPPGQDGAPVELTGGLVRGRDYEDDPEALNLADTHDLATEPAHV
ncbi:single-stranded DNA-binding protein [Geodermatophilus sp. DSM 44513]|uniref:single-stranded DNA-binding protein n=1 Tax=Geodermatophilus sp. DSM 44513 TaxID=1528104 RepID=UPI001275BD34|nr:single-stranded DNA-binding protein [Geodermatophilus sp. DSM 44513]WNV76887.1 single-stranded DNA-binding protein [Geodermatophilus sp. DSM 44513]